ncbi:TIGR03619 family F420-dependent LLM class oxidoreductase [Conexibacter woesei]|uniref:Luciferase-like, subgroup n=1 Tax=Conexibacter woesei (strain DSM 14684 / CCUG 47730 / CIP 108061 / JCM 11494 / NBRC 100937 / ID131577) TaxID=469383 RepID=D3F4M7_CONWI|nr:TIGR03619 family F420-dependent LLM class oxidoreductase [Conexibacter woesei]ADB52484.1 Luciferase-like, subgroup [Conexibacter woesei DSM 14684]
MRFAVMLPQANRLASPEALVEVAQAAEELGFSAVSVRDHVVFNGAYITSGTADLEGPGELRAMFEALETLTWVAAHTSRVRLRTSVLILPNRHPLLLAKQLSTLDVLSGGRLTIGFGVGPNRRETAVDTTKLGAHRVNLEKEYDAFGAHGARGPRMQEYFEAMVAIWTQESASYRGETVAFDDVEVFPKPLQRPYPPIVVGGRSSAALRRAARWDAGWMPSQVTAQEIAAGVAELRALREQAGLAPEPPSIGINVHSAIAESTAAAEAFVAPTIGHHFAGPEALRERALLGDVEAFAARVRAYRDAGVEEIELKPVYRSIDDCVAHLRTIHDEVMPAVA